MPDHSSANNTITASVGEEVSAPRNTTQSSSQHDTGAHFAADYNGSDGEHEENQSVASALENESWGHQSVPSNSLQTSRGEDNNGEAICQQAQAMNSEKFLEVRDHCRWHLNCVQSSLDLFENQTAASAKDTAKYKQQLDELTTAVSAHGKEVIDCTVRLRAYARGGVVPKPFVQAGAQLTSQESYNASKTVPLTFLEMRTMLNCAFEGGKYSLETGTRICLSEEEQLWRQDVFRQIRDQVPHVHQGQENRSYLTSLWRTFIRRPVQTQGGSAGHLGSPDTLPVPDMLSLLFGDPSSQPPLGMASTAPPPPSMAEEGD